MKTIYMQAALDHLRAQGETLNDEEIARLSPLCHGHINMGAATLRNAKSGRRTKSIQPSLEIDKITKQRTSQNSAQTSVLRSPTHLTIGAIAKACTRE